MNSDPSKRIPVCLEREREREPAGTLGFSELLVVINSSTTELFEVSNSTSSETVGQMLQRRFLGE